MAWLVAGGIAIGLLTGKVVRLLEKHIDNAPIEISLSLVTPYLAYLTAELAHSSGVLAVVVAGLYVGQQSSYLFSSRVRIELRAFWDTLTFVLNAIVFLLIGLQLPYILQGIRGITTSELLISAAQLSAAAILLRLIWVFPGAYAGNLFRRRILHRREAPLSPRGVFVVGWTGMRGVVSLAAAIALPSVLANGQPFPQRSALIFLTFSVILVTLVLQGLTLPKLIRSLKLSETGSEGAEERDARCAMLKAALARLEELRTNDPPELGPAYESMERLYRQRLTLAQGGEERFNSVGAKLREVERATIIDMRNRKEIGDHVLRTLERELDLLDVRFAQE